jgi:DnaK suppressor protein
MESQGTRAELEGLRNDLVERLTAIYASVRADITFAMVSRAFPPDRGDEEDEALDDELSSQLDEHAREEEHRLEDALRRMQRGEYGICIDCGCAISIERLRAAPWTERCAEDQMRFEETQRLQPPTL